MKTEHDRNLIHWINDHEHEIIDLASDFVRIPSVTGAEGELARFMAEWLSSKGMDVELRPVSREFRDSFPEFSGEQKLDERPNVYARLHSSKGHALAPIVLNGHLDVVPVGDPGRWRFDPFSAARCEGAIWGRGSADMKGPIAAGLMALVALKECAVPLLSDVQAQIVIAEETGGLGSLAALADQPRPRAAIVLEPSQGRIVSAGAGSVQFTVHAAGRAAHGCAPWEGKSALSVLLKCLARVEAYAERRNRTLWHPLFTIYPQATPLNIGTFSAGEWRATVPESGQFSGRLGILPGEDIDRIREEILGEVTRCRIELQLDPDDLCVTWPNVGFPAWETTGDQLVIHALQSAASALGGQTGLLGVTFGSDAGHFARSGIPVAIFGPGDIAVAHMVDEHVAERALVDASKTLALALTRLAGQ